MPSSTRFAWLYTTTGTCFTEQIFSSGPDEIVKKRSRNTETARVVLIWKDLSLLIKCEVLLEYTRNIAGRLDDMDIIHPAQLLHIFSILLSDA